MPGCGKTTVGQATGPELTGREAIDLDQRIAAPGRLLHPGDLCPGRRGGIPGAGAGGDCRGRCKLSGKILLTGGGVVKTPENYPSLHQNGRIYHLLRSH